MFSALEIIEQVADEPLGRSVAWFHEVAFPETSLGDLLALLHGMARSSAIEFMHADGEKLQDYEIAAFVRRGVACAETFVVATDKGIEYAYGERAER